MQTRTESAIETLLNISSGFVASLLIWTYVVAPIYNIQVDQVQNVTITAIFTVTSVIRSYVWRRFFAKGLHKSLQSYIKRA